MTFRKPCFPYQSCRTCIGWIWVALWCYATTNFPNLSNFALFIWFGWRGLSIDPGFKFEPNASVNCSAPMLMSRGPPQNPRYHIAVMFDGFIWFNVFKTFLFVQKNCMCSKTMYPIYDEFSGLLMFKIICLSPSVFIIGVL